MFIDPPAFVVQRRINHPLTDVQRGLADRAALAPNRLVDLDTEGFLYLAEPLRPISPYNSRQPLPTWCARARLLTSNRRVVAPVELEVSMWSHEATSLSLRPVARHPVRWSARRLRRYFNLAHPAADAAAQLVGRRAMHAVDVQRGAPIRVPHDAEATVGSVH
jgi:hypothetical protein